jgi:hypothetical protein
MIEGPPASPKGPMGSFSPERLLEPLRGSLDAVKRWVTGPPGRREGGDPFLAQLQLAGRIGWAILAGLGLYLLVDVVILQPAAPRLTSAPPASSGGPRVVPVEDAGSRAQAYRQTLAARNPFRLEAGRVEEGPSNQTAKSKLADLTSSLAVVGINRGAVPEALIEDSQAKRTHFVKVGDQINGVTISAIDQEGVKVTYEGEETVLK